jgi:type IV pilus assembly protein PilA
MSCGRSTSWGRERGYTFIEITVVVVVVGLLIVIALPLFREAKEHANNRSAQTSLRHALTAARTLYSDDSSFARVTPADLRAAETGIAFVSGASTGPESVSVDSSATQFVAAAKSASGLCFAIGDAADAAGTVFAILPGNVACDAANATAVPSEVPSPTTATVGGGWAQAW